MSATTLQRRHFTTNNASNYFTLEGLQKETGQAHSHFRHVALKELIDNALDAAETAGVAPDIAIEFTESEHGLTLTITDNGPGIPADVVARIVSNFSSSTSDKAAYRAPLRGAQGNALKTVIGMPVALGAERSRLVIAAAGVLHDLEVWPSLIGDVRHQHHQSPVETIGTRITLLIPGSPNCYFWQPARWLTAFGMFNPHAQLQIREIQPFWETREEIDATERGNSQFSDLSLSPTVHFPEERWRKFLPTDPTPAHWYTLAEFMRLVLACSGNQPEQPIGEFIQEFKGTSRAWRTIAKSVSAKTVGQLSESRDDIAMLRDALLAANPAPKPEVLGRVGPDHFRLGFDQHFGIVNNRYWYKHQWGIADGMPYLIECAIAETEQPGDVFYGLNYSVPFSDPLSTTPLIHDGQERIQNQGLSAFLRDLGVINGSRYGRTLHTAAAIHLVMPLLPALDRGKSRLDISAELACVIAETIGIAAKTLTKEAIDARKNQAKREKAAQNQQQQIAAARERERDRSEREEDARLEREEREQRRLQRQQEREAEAQARKARGELPTQKDALFDLFLSVYLEVTENETIRVSARDFYYAIRPKFERVPVRPRNGEQPELIYGYFNSCLTQFKNGKKDLPYVDYKARGTLYESHTGKEIPIGDKEMRDYALPAHEYAGILVIEKEGIWESLKEIGGIDLVRKYDLMVAACEGYANEATRKLLDKAQRQCDWKIFVWHDADPYGYNIARTIAESTARMPNHSISIIDIGLKFDEGVAAGLQTETFTRKKAIPGEIIPALSDSEYEAFTGIKSGENFRCTRIEINAIPLRQRIAYLESKIAPVLSQQAKPTVEGEAPAEPSRPDIATIRLTADALLHREVMRQIQVMLNSMIDLDAMAVSAKDEVEIPALADDDLLAALDANTAAPWREVVKSAIAERINEDVIDSMAVAVKRVIRQSLDNFL